MAGRLGTAARAPAMKAARRAGWRLKLRPIGARRPRPRCTEQAALRVELRLGWASVPDVRAQSLEHHRADRRAARGRGRDCDCDTLDHRLHRLRIVGAVVADQLHRAGHPHDEEPDRRLNVVLAPQALQRKRYRLAGAVAADWLARSIDAH
ncbi:MAG: hypothetical protein H7306_03295 [Bacteriovorax sp.]|nr:hypothetical protein [Rhizobacter sp.]